MNFTTAVDQQAADWKSAGWTPKDFDVECSHPALVDQITHRLEHEFNLYQDELEDGCDVMTCAMWLDQFDLVAVNINGEIEVTREYEEGEIIEGFSYKFNLDRFNKLFFQYS